MGAVVKLTFPHFSSLPLPINSFIVTSEWILLMMLIQVISQSGPPFVITSPMHTIWKWDGEGFRFIHIVKGSGLSAKDLKFGSLNARVNVLIPQPHPHCIVARYSGVQVRLFLFDQCMGSICHIGKASIYCPSLTAPEKVGDEPPPPTTAVLSGASDPTVLMEREFQELNPIKRKQW